MDNLEKAEYRNLLKKMRKIKRKNDELLELSEYLIQSLNTNILIDDKGINKEDTQYIKQKIATINESIEIKLIPNMERKIS